MHYARFLWIPVYELFIVFSQCYCIHNYVSSIWMKFGVLVLWESSIFGGTPWILPRARSDTTAGLAWPEGGRLEELPGHWPLQSLSEVRWSLLDRAPLPDVTCWGRRRPQKYIKERWESACRVLDLPQSSQVLQPATSFCVPTLHSIFLPPDDP